MKIVFTLLALSYSICGHAQTVDLSKQFKTMKPRAIGVTLLVL